MPRALVSPARAAGLWQPVCRGCTHTHTHTHTHCVCRVMAAADYHSQVRGRLSVLRGLRVSNWIEGKLSQREFL